MTPPPATSLSSSSTAEHLMDNEAAVLPAEDAEESTLPFKGVKDVLLDDDVPISDGLRAALHNLEVIHAPVCVYQKMLTKADRLIGQNRFLVPCKIAMKNRLPFTKIFTKKEMLEVEEGKTSAKKKKEEGDGEEEEKKKNDYGLDMEAYDGEGRTYHIMCRYLTTNGAYRIKHGGWKGFLENNGLLVLDDKPKKSKSKSPKKSKSKSPEAAKISSEAEEGQRNGSSAGEKSDGGKHKEKVKGNGDVRIELWAFRSRKLSIGFTDQDDGALGLIFLHYREGGADQKVQGAAAAPEDGMEEHGAATPGRLHEMAAGNAVDEPEVVVKGEAAATRVSGFTPNELGAAAGLLFLSTSCQGTGDGMRQRRRRCRPTEAMEARVTKKRVGCVGHGVSCRGAYAAERF